MVPTFPWIEIIKVKSRAAVDDLLQQQKLDLGEAEAIILAIDLNANLLIIDEQLGRSVAKQKGLEITGLLGALLEAKSKGIILHVKPIVDDLVAQAKFRVSADLYRKILSLASESSPGP
jgi:predicted nucleic acid-binding protein